MVLTLAFETRIGERRERGKGWCDGCYLVAAVLKVIDGYCGGSTEGHSTVVRLKPVCAGIEPVSVCAADSRRERVWRGQRLGRDFRPRRPVSRHRDWDLLRHLRQGPEKFKTFPPGTGNRICAGLRGAGRTRTIKQAIMGTAVAAVSAPTLVITTPTAPGRDRVLDLGWNG
jgi:hypothetical protein